MSVSKIDSYDSDESDTVISADVNNDGRHQQADTPTGHCHPAHLGSLLINKLINYY